MRVKDGENVKLNWRTISETITSRTCELGLEDDILMLGEIWSQLGKPCGEMERVDWTNVAF